MEADVKISIGMASFILIGSVLALVLYPPF